MKTKYTFTKLTCLLFALMTCGLVTGQGVDNNYGSSNNAGHTGGITWIGDSGGFHLSLDNNEVQSRFGTAANTLYLNYYGGDVDILGSSNPTGDLMVDFNGLYYDNSADRVGIGTASPGQKLEVNITGQDGITINGDDTGDARLYIENGGGNHYLFDDDSDSHTLKLESGVSRALAF
ncbi:MAG: hypothetical protein HKO66_14270, partial [Saprospiraceae bacterium]|nr:hypothetical protein [Bacteroidia bacterium]NNL93403.1 hypothetical protein [Saprospiraceae bacterium]